MPHRSYPPSHYNPPAFPTAALLAMMRPHNRPRGVVSTPRDAAVRERAPAARVRIVPSPDGIITIVGVTTDTQEWVAEYRCRSEDFDENVIRAMERRVMAKERATLKIVR